MASTKAYVDTSINNLIDGAPSTLDTLNEIAAAQARQVSLSGILYRLCSLEAPLALQELQPPFEAPHCFQTGCYSPAYSGTDSPPPSPP